MCAEYTAASTRYDSMEYNRVGASGLKLPCVTLGLWHNFGTYNDYDNMKKKCRVAFDNGITSFDIANNYGPVPGSAEANFGKILKDSVVSSVLIGASKPEQILDNLKVMNCPELTADELKLIDEICL